MPMINYTFIILLNVKYYIRSLNKRFNNFSYVNLLNNFGVQRHILYVHISKMSLELIRMEWEKMGKSKESYIWQWIKISCSLLIILTMHKYTDK